jgi:hypothetical protein
MLKKQIYDNYARDGKGEIRDGQLYPEDVTVGKLTK